MKFQMTQSVEIMHQHFEIVGVSYDPISGFRSYSLVDHKGNVLKDIPEYSLAISVTPEMIKEQGEK